MFIKYENISFQHTKKNHNRHGVSINWTINNSKKRVKSDENLTYSHYKNINRYYMLSNVQNERIIWIMGRGRRERKFTSSC